MFFLITFRAAQIFKKKLKDTFNLYGAKMYYFNDTENWVSNQLIINQELIVIY